MVKKIIIAIPCLCTGGTEMQTLMLAKILHSCGFKIEVHCYFEFNEYVVEEFRLAGLHVELLNLNRRSGPLALIRILQKKFRSVKPDIVHIQYMSPGALPIFAARLAGVRTVLATVHQPYTMSHGLSAKIILRTASLFTTKFITVSRNAEKTWFGSSYLFDENKPSKQQHRHFTIYNTIDDDSIQRLIHATKGHELKHELHINNEKTIIGVISRLRHEKGIDLLIDAFSLLAESKDRAHLLIVGTGPDEEQLKTRVRELGISTQITFYGHAEWERAMELLSIMDLVVVPSRFEGFGLTAVEAMAAGKPVIASDTTGLKEIVIDNETGILVPVDDVSSLKRGIVQLISDPQLRRSLGIAGRGRVKELFSIEIFMNKIKVLYGSLS